MAKAIVFVWRGNTIDYSAIEEMAGILVTHGACNAENIKAKLYDDDGLADAIVANTVTTKRATKTTVNEEDDAVKNAIVYIETLFPAIRTSYINFVVDLVSTLQNNPSKELCSAIHILANANPTNRHLVELQSVVLTAIKNVYKRHKSSIDNYVS